MASAERGIAPVHRLFHHHHRNSPPSVPSLGIPTQGLNCLRKWKNRHGYDRGPSQNPKGMVTRVDSIDMSLIKPVASPLDAHYPPQLCSMVVVTQHDSASLGPAGASCWTLTTLFHVATYKRLAACPGMAWLRTTGKGQAGRLHRVTALQHYKVLEKEMVDAMPRVYLSKKTTRTNTYRYCMPSHAGSCVSFALQDQDLISPEEEAPLVSMEGWLWKSSLGSRFPHSGREIMSTVPVGESQMPADRERAQPLTKDDDYPSRAYPRPVLDTAADA
ncbi:hypothetical protein V490_02032 [Pseudogymnoascus sp. VKM F-3557]|nr:hypothetical protein V490_02032 [Pseudogymnoascus sp. VKM F-3557]